jgi:hypothetical protein
LAVLNLLFLLWLLSSCCWRCFIDPLGQDLCLLFGKLNLDLGARHARVLVEINDIFPRKVLHSILYIGLTSEMTECGRLVVLWFAQDKVPSQGTGASIKVDLDNIGDELGSEALNTTKPAVL